MKEEQIDLERKRRRLPMAKLIIYSAITLQWATIFHFLMRLFGLAFAGSKENLEVLVPALFWCVGNALAEWAYELRGHSVTKGEAFWLLRSVTLISAVGFLMPSALDEISRIAETDFSFFVLFSHASNSASVLAITVLSSVSVRIAQGRLY